ncbi:hypothetical protein B0H67DRAFT_558337 [Lasiosphaeris hirsuta]|uniref:Uncharacterized protein n=1 Tax=Lasiosphaeris hirsuta TaxID=260670 RepID=A0AA39ZSC5_9PEZI|nr:hypothetical protein B0H67DRAFT_558337 [Lasiosphaeris hirsuta]
MQTIKRTPRADKEDGEEYIVTAALASDGPTQELILFKKGRTDYRLVPTEEIEGKVQPSPYRKEKRFNICVDKFVARYTLKDTPVVVDLYLQGHREPVTYKLKSLQDAWNFQRAITGYEVIGNSETFRSDARASTESPESPTSDNTTLAPFSIAASQRTVNTFLAMETVIQGGTLEQLEPPTAPVIATFGYSEKFYRCYILPVRRHLFIDRSACRCTLEGDGGDCKILVIHSSSGEKFEVLDHSTPDDARDAIKHWNLAIFRGPNRSVEYNDLAIVGRISCEKLQLVFQTAEERKSSRTLYRWLGASTSRPWSNTASIRTSAEHAGDHPKGPTRNVYGSPSSSAASALGATPRSFIPVSETPPTIGTLPAVSRLSLGWSRYTLDEPPVGGKGAPFRVDHKFTSQRNIQDYARIDADFGQTRLSSAASNDCRVASELWGIAFWYPREGKDRFKELVELEGSPGFYYYFGSFN